MMSSTTQLVTGAGSVQTATASASNMRLGDFFRYHGIWAPGVRLFRSIGFQAKALIIAATFIVPIAVLSWGYLSSQADQIEFSAKERVGLVYAREAMPLLALLEKQRLLQVRGADKDAANALADVKREIDTRLGQLAEVEKRHGGVLGTSKSYAAFLQAGQAITSVAATDKDAVNKSHTAYIQSLIDLLGAATDGSNLTLDPDIDTYYLMDTLLFRLPLMIESAGQIELEAASVLATGQATVAQTRHIVEQLTLLSSNQSAVDVDLAKSAAYNADVAQAVKGQGEQVAVKGLVDHLEAHVLRADGVKGEPQAFAVQAQGAMQAMLKLGQDAESKLDALLQARVDRFLVARDMEIAITVFALLMSAYLFMSFRKVLDGGLKEVAFHINAMRDGDLTTQPRAWGADEAANLMHTLTDMQQSLRRIVVQVRSASDGIVVASSEIAGGANDLSGRTEQSAANLEETASAMEQIAATVKHNEASVDAAADLARMNAQAATRGGQIISEVVRTMQDINGSSSRIGDIIGTIEGIAFQTNILALNAAVEAARAGEQGRGFAVVASEVRALAQRSSVAAKEIKDLISASVAQADGGAKVVRQAGEAIGELVDSAQRVSTLLSEVSLGAREQTSGIVQTTKAVQEMDTVTQQNAALVEQTAAAAGSLQDQARGLASEVSRFKLPAH